MIQLYREACTYVKMKKAKMDEYRTMGVTNVYIKQGERRAGVKKDDMANCEWAVSQPLRVADVQGHYATTWLKSADAHEWFSPAGRTTHAPRANAEATPVAMPKLCIRVTDTHTRSCGVITRCFAASSPRCITSLCTCTKQCRIL